MSATYPTDLRYTKDHEWARIDADGDVVVGITAHAVDSLGDITLVTLPGVGERVEAHKRFGDIDSVKAVSELFSPIAGEIVEVNARLADAPELVNQNPYADGWMVKIRPADRAELDALLTSEQYAELLRNS